MDATYEPGSDADFDRLYRDTHDRAVRTLTALLRDPAAAEECAQEAFVRAYRAWPRWKPDAPAEAWIHRIAINVATSHRRREALRTLGNLLRLTGPPRTEVQGPEASIASELVAALRRMPPKQAATLVLRHHHGYTNREIGAALGVPESTVASRLAAAKSRLRVELEGEQPGPGPVMEEVHER